LCSASSGTSHRLPINHSGNILKLEGVKVAEIWDVIPILSFNLPYVKNKEVVRELMATATRTCFRGASFRSPKHKSFTRTLCANFFTDRVLPPHPQVPTTEQSEAIVHRILTSDIDDQPGWGEDDVEHVLPSIRRFCKGRALYMTDDGIPGLAPPTAKEGDIITVMLGCDSPIILRPTQDGSYKFIGEAYCDGCMHGEALLGPLPDSFETVWRYDYNPECGYFRWAYRNKETGKFQPEDPRLGPLPLEWSYGSHPEDEFWQAFVKDNPGNPREVTLWDPRLSSEALRRRGVPLRVFELV
jgi:hypothetical protein